MLAVTCYLLFPMVDGLWGIHEATVDILSGGHN
jgi:hypothetical protein